MRSKLQQYYEDLGATGTISARTVGYRSERSWLGIRDAVRRLIPADLGEASVLDVGCGHGAMVREWALMSRVIGVDLARSLLRLARDNGLLAVEADGLALPFRRDTFDVVMAIELLPQVPDAARLLEGLVGVTRVGGVILLGTPNRRSIVRRISHAAVSLRVVPRGAPECIPLPLLRTAGELLSLAARFPLVLEHAATTYYPLATARAHPRMGAIRALLASNIVLKFRKTRD